MSPSALLFAGLAAAAFSAPGLGYTQPERVAHLADALGLLETTELSALRAARRHIEAMGRSACTSDFERLRIECLLTAARRYCRSRSAEAACADYADVIVSNVLAEAEVLSTAERYALLQQSSDPRQAIEREILRRQGDLAVDLRLSSPPCAAGDRACLAGNIDRFCLRAADARQLSWQTCAGTLAWFITTVAR